VRFLIVNADDFGYGAGVNRGIADAHDRGVVTSAGLIVNAPGAEEAAALAAARPRLSLGLHVNFTNEAQRLVEFDDPAVCRAELRRQLERFVELTGRLPTHLDSHQHVHRRRTCLPSFEELAGEHGLPLRDRPPVTFKGGFYGQLEYGVPQLERVGFEALERMLRDELREGVYELACHPAHFDADASYVYHRERERELATLCDARLPPLLRELGLSLISYHELPAALAQLSREREEWAS
jgi:predicted glycoside hydrolase/deacetylase ChbG (UPF0249 family)